MSRKGEKNRKSMYYDDHLAAAEKEISSRNFCNLVDAAVILYVEEKEADRILKSSCNTKTETLSEKEKDIDYIFFNVFPRKRRSPSKKFGRVQSYETLNKASTSSPLFDLNKTPDDSETEAPSNPLPCFYVSSPQSFLTAHPSSSTLTEESSRKRRAPQERKRITGGKSKKVRVPPFSWKGRATPEWLVSLLEVMAATTGHLVNEGPWLIFEKKLTSTDVDPAQSRLLMPFNSLIRNDFLTPVELRIVAEEDEKNGVGAMLVDQQKKKWGLILMRREMIKGAGNGTSNYALICGWNDVVQDNGLKEDDDISVWYFRWRERLCFALVLPPPDMAQSSSSPVLCV
ncbi:unnamed protein product [Eruca vesicaria subsp. sativa]|uniref:TF-B3 domain-containing protein n=1 Tax=Eruca vesicaria subsp. sativa TaxID=29727 RepID=A0ABC8M3K7_ERUVS|nr:unnamed protein product [Eruca vesicaria subsp. sativa]